MYVLIFYLILILLFYFKGTKESFKDTDDNNSIIDYNRIIKTVIDYVLSPLKNEPKVNKPKVNKPKVNKPTVNKPKVNKPKVNKPKVNKPTVNKPTVNKPKVNKPTVNKPTVNEPKVNKPKVNEPKVNEPKVNEPKVNEPKVNEPKVNEPKVNKKESINKINISEIKRLDNIIDNRIKEHEIDLGYCSIVPFNNGYYNQYRINNMTIIKNIVEKQNKILPKNYTKNYKLLNTKLSEFKNESIDDTPSNWRCLNHINRPWYNCNL